MPLHCLTVVLGLLYVTAGRAFPREIGGIAKIEAGSHGRQKPPHETKRAASLKREELSSLYKIGLRREPRRQVHFFAFHKVDQDRSTSPD